MKAFLNFGEFGWHFNDKFKVPVVRLTVAEKDQKLNELICLASPNSEVLREVELSWWDNRLGRRVTRHGPQINYCKKHDRHYSSDACIKCEEHHMIKARYLRGIKCA